VDYNEFVKLVERNEELNFKVGNYEYWVSNNPEGYYLTKCEYQEFATEDDLFNYARIEGNLICELWDDISVQLSKYEDYDELVTKVKQGEQPYFEINGYLYMIENNQLQIDLARDTLARVAHSQDFKLPSKIFTLGKSITQNFQTADELLRNGTIEGKSIFEQWPHIEI